MMRRFMVPRRYVRPDSGETAPARGLRGIADRAEALGGTFALDGPPGGPTRLRVELPYA
jgi:signal transduction histidine kinase